MVCCCWLLFPVVFCCLVLFVIVVCCNSGQEGQPKEPHVLRGDSGKDPPPVKQKPRSQGIEVRDRWEGDPRESPGKGSWFVVVGCCFLLFVVVWCCLLLLFVVVSCCCYCLWGKHACWLLQVLFFHLLPLRAPPCVGRGRRIWLVVWNMNSMTFRILGIS